MSSTFRETFNAIRQEVQVGAARVFDEAKPRHRCLAHHTTVFSVLAVMGEESPSGWSEREALTRALIAEHQATSLPFWASTLLVAYYPMLSRLRHRIWGEALDHDDLDQLVISCFLQVVAVFPLAEVTDRTALRLRQRTERRVFKAVRHEQQAQRSHAELGELAEEPSVAPFDEERLEPTSEVDAEETVAMLIDLAGQHLPGQNLDLVVATILKRERLRHYVKRVNGDEQPHERVYQRLKRRRTRAVNRLRDLLEATLGPRSDSCVL